MEERKMNSVLTFLQDLEENNSLEWMKCHKEQYLEAKNEFIKFIQDLMCSISVFDSSVADLRAEDLIFRLNKDTRFSKDKTPYNASFRAHISTAGRTPIPAGYYISIKLSSSFLGGGLFATQFPQATTMVRDYIIKHPKEFQSIISSKDFTANFTLEGDKLKNIPRGYDKEHPLREYLKHKSWDIEYCITDQKLIENDITFITQKFQLMKPLNDYLNKALHGFSMPERK
jgi:uncharacterized protein (TIGR02453 family)